jgi:NitT/TauT family transport system substrate-binding protein
MVRIEKGGWAVIFLAGLALVAYSVHQYGLLDLSAVFGAPTVQPVEGARPAEPPRRLEPLPKDVQALSNEIRVRVNPRVGCAPGLVANGGLETQQGSIYHRRGIRVRFEVIDDWNEAAEALAGNRVDAMFTTADVWARDYARFRERGFGARAVMLAGWSRGADGVIARQGIGSVEDLAGKTVAFAPHTPSHFLLWNGLRASGLSSEQRGQILNRALHTKDGVEPALLFASQKVDAAVAWEPEMSDALAKRAGASKLYDTAAANRLVADIVVVSESYAEHNPKTLIAFIEGWLEAAAFTRDSPSRAYNLIGSVKDFNIPADAAKAMLAGVHLADFADNRQFFGAPNQDSDYTNIFRLANEMYRELRLIRRIENPEGSVDYRFLDSIGDRGVFPAESSERPARYRRPAPGATPVATRRLYLWFPPNSAELVLDSRLAVDDLGRFLRAYGNTVVSIDGSTDSKDSRDAGTRLSKRRADAVRDYLAEKHGIARDRMQTGAAAGNAGSGSREQNGHTEFRVYLNPEAS